MKKMGKCRGRRGEAREIRRGKDESCWRRGEGKSCEKEKRCGGGD